MKKIHILIALSLALLATLGAVCDLPTQSGVNNTIDEVCTKEIDKVLTLVDEIRAECDQRAEEAEAQCLQAIDDVKVWIESEAEDQLLSMGCTKTSDGMWDCSISSICDDPDAGP